MEFRDKVVVVTGGAQGIGKCIVEEFHREGAKVCVIDKKPFMSDGGNKECGNGDCFNSDDYFQGDISNQGVIEDFCKWVTNRYGHIDIIVNNALPLMKGIDECSYEEFQYALNVGITAPFYIVKCLKDYLVTGASIVNISSSRDRMSMPQTESYTAAKGGIASLTHALAVSLAGKARVNSISPGWINTNFESYQGPDATQQPAGRVGNPLDIANMVLFLCSKKSGFITGENICIDGGMTRVMIYHGEHGWTLNE